MPAGFNKTSSGTQEYVKIMEAGLLKQTFADEPLLSIDRRVTANMSQTWYIFNLTMEGLEIYLKIKGITEMPRSFLERFVAALWLTVLSGTGNGREDGTAHGRVEVGCPQLHQ